MLQQRIFHLRTKQHRCYIREQDNGWIVCAVEDKNEMIFRMIFCQLRKTLIIEITAGSISRIKQ